MSRGVVGALAFVLGAAAGSLVTWKLIEKKYADIADEEIQSVKEMYSRKMADKNRDLKKADVSAVVNEFVDAVKVDKKDYATNSSLTAAYTSPDERADYNAYSAPKQEEKSTDIPEDRPYVIPPEDFGEFDEYETIELTYYADGILCEDNTDIVDDPEKIVGFESLGHFGEYDDDAVYVRNDRLKCDYEILRDPRRYEEVL